MSSWPPTLSPPSQGPTRARDKPTVGPLRQADGVLLGDISCVSDYQHRAWHNTPSRSSEPDAVTCLGDAEGMMSPTGPAPGVAPHGGESTGGPQPASDGQPTAYSFLVERADVQRGRHPYNAERVRA